MERTTVQEGQHSPYRNAQGDFVPALLEAHGHRERAQERREMAHRHFRIGLIDVGSYRHEVAMARQSWVQFRNIYRKAMEN